MRNRTSTTIPARLERRWSPEPVWKSFQLDNDGSSPTKCLYVFGVVFAFAQGAGRAVNRPEAPLDPATRLPAPPKTPALRLPLLSTLRCGEAVASIWVNDNRPSKRIVRRKTTAMPADTAKLDQAMEMDDSRSDGRLDEGVRRAWRCCCRTTVAPGRIGGGAGLAIRRSRPSRRCGVVSVWSAHVSRGLETHVVHFFTVPCRGSTVEQHARWEGGLAERLLRCCVSDNNKGAA